jgi:hypothetical protein
MSANNIKCFAVGVLILTEMAISAAPMTDTATHESLSETHKRNQLADPLKKLKPAEGTDPSLVSPPKDLISDSDFLCFGGLATLIPKRAVIHIPKSLAVRMKYIDGSKIVSWADFYALNRGWLSTVEVTFVQAEGKKSLAEPILARISKSQNLIVATYMNGPISVLPLKVTPSPNSQITVKK